MSYKKSQEKYCEEMENKVREIGYEIPISWILLFLLEYEYLICDFLEGKEPELEFEDMMRELKEGLP